MILDKKYYDAYTPAKGAIFWIKNLLAGLLTDLFKTQRYLKTETPCALGWPQVKEHQKLSYHNCLAISKLCPTSALIVGTKNGEQVSQFDLRVERCTQCALCVTLAKDKILEMGVRNDLALHAEQDRAISLLTFIK